MKYLSSVLLCLLLQIPVFTVSAASLDIESVLTQLDNVILNKTQYQEQREERIRALKERFAASKDNKEKYDLCGGLFYEYLHYQADSSLYYVNARWQYLPYMENPQLRNEIIINRAEVMGVMGMYNEAYTELEKIHPAELNKDLLGYYYRTRRAHYGWIADYTSNLEEKQKYLRATQLYRDSILLISPPSLDREITYAEKLILYKRPDEAIRILHHFDVETLSPQQQAYYFYTMSEAYKEKEDMDNEIYFLAKTALVDLKMAVREYASLQKLARLMYECGNLDRAYRYLNCSMEDAVACNARLRFLEVTEFYPIIDKAYRAKEAQERMVVRNLLIGISILALLLVAAVFYLYHWMRKLAAMRSELKKANGSLLHVNQELEETGKIKEVYIARYLDRCVIYLDKLEQYRRSLEKLAMASKIEELYRTIKSDQFLREERKSFYQEFDKSFLELFPHFIEKFNALLVDEAKFYPKSGELLNTELRIFALIRLGVTDSSRIAHFLGYSLATVYNYRSKIRNKALGDKDLFEQKVMSL